MIYLFLRRRRFCFSSSSLSLLLETSLFVAGVDDIPANVTAFVADSVTDGTEDGGTETFEGVWCETAELEVVKNGGIGGAGGGEVIEMLEGVS